MQVEKKAVFLVSKEKGDTSCLERNAFAINLNFKRKKNLLMKKKTERTFVATWRVMSAFWNCFFITFLEQIAIYSTVISKNQSPNF